MELEVQHASVIYPVEGGKGIQALSNVELQPGKPASNRHRHPAGAGDPRPLI